MYIYTFVKPITISTFIQLQLYEALHVEEHQIKKERELSTRVEQLTDELLPYEKVGVMWCWFLLVFGEVTQSFICALHLHSPREYTDPERDGRRFGAQNRTADVGRPGHDGRSVWHPGAVDVVGVLVGHYGAGDVFRDLRHGDGSVRVLLLDETGAQKPYPPIVDMMH